MTSTLRDISTIYGTIADALAARDEHKLRDIALHLALLADSPDWSLASRGRRCLLVAQRAQDECDTAIRALDE